MYILKKNIFAIIQSIFVKYLLLISAIIVIPLIDCVCPIYAQEVISDNTTNTRVQFSDKTYTVSGGKIIEDVNQFHSFEKFNVYAGETVHFTGPNSIKNIINRVTGGESWINGLLKSSIEGADLFFLNPDGVIFGPEARLDVKGSFYVSTADYLKMQDNSIFYASTLQSSLLTSSPPVSFGFLDNTIASIQFEGGKSLESEYPGLVVTESKTIAVVGGDIELQQASFINSQSIKKASTTSSLYAPSGQIYLLSTASEGVIDFTEKHPDISYLNKLGTITLSNRSSLDISGDGAGNIHIQANQITFDNSRIISESYGVAREDGIALIAEKIHFTNGSNIIGRTRGNGSGGYVSLKGDTILFDGINSSTVSSYISIDGFVKATSGQLILDAKDITFLDGAYLSASTFGSGESGQITLLASETILFKGKNNLNDNIYSGSRIYVRTYSKEDDAGNGGSLTMEAKNIRIEDGAFVTASTTSKGDGGEIKLNAKESVILSGDNTCIKATVMRHEANTGNGGSIQIDAKNIQIKNGAYIESSTYSKGKAGNISLNATHSINISGVKDNAINIVSANAFGQYENSGDSGEINIHANRLNIFHSGNVSTSTTGKAKAGNIKIIVNDLVMDQQSFVSSSSGSIGSNNEGGSITIESINNIHLNNQSYISTSTRGTDRAGIINLRTTNLLLDNANVKSSSSSDQMAGDAGFIHINTLGKTKLTHNSSILTESVSSGGGLVSVNTPDLLLINSRLSTSVKDFSGDGGKININAVLVTLMHSSINADAYEGSGGEINIKTDHFLEYPINSVTAISIYGNHGTVSITSFNNTEKINIFDLNTDFLLADKWLTTPCKKRSKADTSYLIVSELLASPSAITDFKASPYLGCSLMKNTKESIAFNHTILSDYLQLKKDFDE